MKAEVTIRLHIDVSSIKTAQWIAEEVRDYALNVVAGVNRAEISRIEEASTDGEA